MELTGVGLYTFQEAARLTKIAARDLRRWLCGYTYHHKDREAPIAVGPLWEKQFDHEVNGLGFHDLLEVRFVHAFRQHGVSLKTIRIASQRARELLANDYPFTSRLFRTDGRTIFASVFEQEKETHLLDLVRNQYAFRRVIEPSLYSGIDFDKNHTASRWYPTPRSKAIVLDPQIAFGKPIVTHGAIRTSVLYDAYRAEGDKSRVAKLYEVPLTSVDAAITFEEALAAA